MTDHYARLIQLTVAHEYFRSGVVEAMHVRPPEETRRAIDDAGLLVRQIGPVWLLGVEVEMVEPTPEDDPEPHVIRPLPADVLKLGLLIDSPVVPLVSEVGGWQPGATVHYLSNLTPGGSEEDAPFLTDHVAGERLGPPITLVTRSSWTYALSAPASEVDLTLTDLFGTTVTTQTVVFEAPVNGVPLDLASMGLTAGRYTVSDTDGGSETIYYAPSLDGEPLFAMIELYVSSVSFTGSPDQVVGDYRFLDGDIVTEVAPFQVEIPVRTTHWQYVVEKKYADNGIDLDRVDITGDLAFNKTSADAERATFESGTAVAWAEEPATVTLEDHRGRALRRLPVPRPGTVLRDRDTGGQSAVHFVYL